MQFLVEARGWIDARVDDVYGARVGSVVDVYFDPEDEEQLYWMLVRVGSSDGPLTLVPVHHSIATRAHVWVPITKDLIVRAPELDERARVDARRGARALLPLRRSAAAQRTRCASGRAEAVTAVPATQSPRDAARH